VRALEFRDGLLAYLDQTRLPAEEFRVETSDYQEVARAIRRLAIRGAPLIGIAAAYGVALAAKAALAAVPSMFHNEVTRAIDLLLATRPTAINLAWALNRQRTILNKSTRLNEREIAACLASEAISIHREEGEKCERISDFGAELLPNAATVLTHCNTGALATGGRGTALGVISKVWEQMKLKKVYVDETRPLLQGSRLTAWELGNLRIPFELIADSAAAFLMQRGLVNCVIVGADRIAANGDVANKIGTYSLAVLARHHSIPFYVAAPCSTIDLQTESGKAIPIEQRAGEELTEFCGVSLAPKHTQTYTPAFDITPAELVSAIITDAGVCRAPYKETLRTVLFSEIAA
jgi:methylthioribose-1-phosphate isomerase